MKISVIGLMTRGWTAIVGMGLALLLAGCASEGPLAISVSAEDISRSATTTPDGAYTDDYFLFKLDPEIVEVVGDRLPVSFGNTFGLGSAVDRQRIGVGDELSVVIWEAGDSGLFTTPSGETPRIDVMVDQDGMIFIPFAGRMKVAGRTIESVRQTIQLALEQSAVEPQVQLLVSAPRSHAAVIVGDVGKPGRYPISPAGTDVLDLVAEASGATAPAYETIVRLKRGDRTASALLEHIFNEPRNNVPLAPNDNLLLVHDPRSFTAFGAVKSSGVVAFNAPKLTLAEAIAKSEGLDDRRADAGGIFLFRYEDRDLVERLKPELARSGVLKGYTHIPVVYQLSMQTPKGFFLARQFQMRDKDVLYVANSLSAEFGKFLDLVGPVFTAARSIDILTSN